MTVPRKRAELHKYAHTIREQLHLKKKQPFPVMYFLEIVLVKLYPDFNFEIEEPGVLGDNIYAFYDVAECTIHIDQNVYNRACNNVSRDLFTIAHEISHVLLLNKGNILAARSRKYEAFRDPEWQANELAAELLAPHDALKNLTVEEAAQNYHISKKTAQIQKSKK